MTIDPAAFKKILVIGSGGREHAICWKLAQSPRVEQIWCAPGNGGTATEAKTQNVAISPEDFPALIAFAKSEKIDLTVVGPDNPLAEGIVDAFQAAGLQIWGPNQSAAQLEASKVFAKEFMQRHNIPTAKFRVFTNLEDAYLFCEQTDWARVIKVDGLALGKGVFVCNTLGDCQAALDQIFKTSQFGKAAAKVLVEAKMSGPELSLMVLSDGKTLLPMASSRDYKRRFDGDTGSNTGGMGSYSPVRDYTARDWEARIGSQVIAPLQTALLAEKINFVGVIFIGLMMVDDQPMVLEFNARFGDPETQVLLPRLKTDLFDVFEACMTQSLDRLTLKWHDDQAAVCVVLSAESYPASGSKGQSITLPTTDEVLIFHAGTQHDETGHLVTNGGRVLNIVALGETHQIGREKVYTVLSQNQWFETAAYRHDIALCEVPIACV